MELGAIKKLIASVTRNLIDSKAGARLKLGARPSQGRSPTRIKGQRLIIMTGARLKYIHQKLQKYSKCKLKISHQNLTQKFL